MILTWSCIEQLFIGSLREYDNVSMKALACLIFLTLFRSAPVYKAIWTFNLCFRNTFYLSIIYLYNWKIYDIIYLFHLHIILNIFLKNSCIVESSANKANVQCRSIILLLTEMFSVVLISTYSYLIKNGFIHRKVQPNIIPQISKYEILFSISDLIKQILESLCDTLKIK